MSDNAQTFVYYEFRIFLQEKGIIYKLSASYHPTTNRPAERYVQTSQQSLSALEGNIQEKGKKLSTFLRNYRKTP